MTASRLGLVVDIGLIVAVVGLGLAGIANYLLNHTIDPTMQQLFVALVALLQARIGMHVVAIRADQRYGNGSGH